VPNAKFRKQICLQFRTHLKFPASNLCTGMRHRCSAGLQDREGIKLLAVGGCRWRECGGHSLQGRWSAGGVVWRQPALARRLGGGLALLCRLSRRWRRGGETHAARREGGDADGDVVGIMQAASVQLPHAWWEGRLVVMRIGRKMDRVVCSRQTRINCEASDKLIPRSRLLGWDALARFRLV
jgi:hypothetical protein